MRTQRERLPLPPRTRASGAVSRCAVSTSSSRVLPEDKTNTSHRMDELRALPFINLAAQMSNVDINHVVQRRGTVRFAPHVSGEHLSRYGLAVMSQPIG